jgi:Holliday junction resolvase
MDEQKKKAGARSRRRGADGERELAKILQDKGFDVKRGMVFYGQSDVVGLKGVHIEVKRVERLNVHQAMRQSVEEAKEKGDGIPVVMFRRNREPWMVLSFLDDWLPMYGAWRERMDE